MTEIPMVAVYMITYNHNDYIDQAIASVLNQKVTFPIQLFIGDDGSSDGTFEKCQTWKAQFPDQITLLDRQINQGVFKNASRVFEACVASGAKYTALLEGDDYWSGLDKLQRQISILEEDEGVAGCYHNTSFLYQDGVLKPMKKSLPQVLNLGDVISQYAPFHTSSFVFRNQHFCRPSWFQNIDSVDLAMYVWHAQFGRFRGIDEQWSVYRIHATSLTAGESHRKNFDDRRVILHRMMCGKIQHDHWEKYRLLIQSHLKKSEGSWQKFLPSPVVFFVDQREKMNQEWRSFRMKLNAEILNSDIGQDTEFYCQGKNIRLSRTFKFWNRLVWNWKIKRQMGTLPQHIFFTNISDYLRFKNFFGSMDVHVHMMFPMEQEQLEKEKKFYPNLQSMDWLALGKDEQFQFVVNWNLTSRN
ncbi:MAG: glycosyltransferase [Bacteroidetes bacterium]|nr:glycosyltransferase [Bacteroidota bacterium]